MTDTTTNLTDEERTLLAKVEYDPNMYIGRPIYVGNKSDKKSDDKSKGKLIGYVAQVINNPASGEQSYIITDRKINSEADKAKVTNVTVLYRGSTPIDEPGADMAEDWLLNDLPEAAQILIPESPAENFIPLLGGSKDTPAPQFITSASTLNNAMADYPNAMFDIYGHSLGAVDGQYAAASANDPSRIRNAYLYEGPNIYDTLNGQQRETVKELHDRVFIYVDEKDIVPMAPFDYRAGQPTAGTVCIINSNNGKDPIDQHNFGGYHYGPNGTLAMDALATRRFAWAKSQVS